MKTITQEQARELVKNTKGYFRTILVSKFGFDLITTEKPIEVSDEFYEHMKKCFKEKQSDVFDKIFGKDEEKQYPPKGTVCFVWDDDESKQKYGVISTSLGNGRFSQLTLRPDRKGIPYKNYEIYDPKKHFKTRK